MVKRPPRLLLPAVEVEVRPDGSGGVGRAGSTGPSLPEPIVEDRPRRPKRRVFRDGEDLADRAEVVEFFRPSVPPRPPRLVEEAIGWPKEGEGSGEPDPGTVAQALCAQAGECSIDSGAALVETRGVPPVTGLGPGNCTLSGKGNRGVGVFLRRFGRRKKVVVVETVCVVVVVAYAIVSPLLPSEREDSESREMGRAREELLSSP